MLFGALGCHPSQSLEPSSSDTYSAQPPTNPIAEWTNAEFLAEGERYLQDPEFRRETLEASLTSHTNLYAQRRLTSYGLVDRGWDRLPVWNPKTRSLRIGPNGLATSNSLYEPLWGGERPKTFEGWRALGERVFFDYPVRVDPHAGYAIDDASRAKAHGLEPNAEGEWLGVVEYIDIEGQERRGITCALCHVAEVAGQSVVGRARRTLDYGQLRLEFEAVRGAVLDPQVETNMAVWGAGRADVSDDEDIDPVAIPDLWGLRELKYLTQAGTLRQVHPAALAIRQETQILHANGDRTRPPRELAWALTVFLYSLEPPAKVKGPAPRDARSIEVGRNLFARYCESCHAGAAGSGELVPARAVGTAPQLANSRARGTGKYRPAPLVDVARSAPYLHDASVGGLGELLSPKRFAEDYVVGLLAPGPVNGHRFGTELSREERDALVHYLETL